MSPSASASSASPPARSASRPRGSCPRWPGRRRRAGRPGPRMPREEVDLGQARPVIVLHCRVVAVEDVGDRRLHAVACRSSPRRTRRSVPSSTGQVWVLPTPQVGQPVLLAGRRVHQREPGRSWSGARAVAEQDQPVVGDAVEVLAVVAVQVLCSCTTPGPGSRAPRRPARRRRGAAWARPAPAGASAAVDVAGPGGARPTAATATTPATSEAAAPPTTARRPRTRRRPAPTSDAEVEVVGRGRRRRSRAAAP